MNRTFWTMACLATLAFSLGTASHLYAQANAKVPDTDPEIERKSFIVADGFEVNLFAADPLLAKPIQMNFDSQGRLWVASSEVYPQIKPGQKANDKIIVLEDTNNDGKADKTTVFADGLLIPTGVEPGDGGAYVANSTELVHFSASKPGEKADRSRVVLSGFGTEDTHHILHTLRWGPDGMLYMNQSIYIHSHIETPHGVRRLNGGGIWQFRPETMQLEVFVRGFVNTWGHHFDKWGQSFITDGAYGEGINHGIPGAYYVTAVGSGNILKGMNPGSPKHCGLEIVSGRHLPDDWQGNMLTNDFRGHRVCRFVLRDDGSTYESKEKQELIKTNHGAFRPIDIKMGPDGAIYIADWYNPIIQHGEVDFRDPRRDHTHGRIWRVTAKGRPLVAKPDLIKATTAQLLERLKDPEDWTRHHAKRVLKERGAKEVLPVLVSWLQGLDKNNANYEQLLLEGLWVYQSLDVVEPKILATALQAKDFRVRGAASRVLATWYDRVPNSLELLTPRVADEAPRVRMEAVRSLAMLKNPRAAEVALTALDRPVDKILEYALWLTARDLEPYWMPAFREGKIDFGGNARHLTFALQATGSNSAVQPLLALAKSGKVAKDREEAVWSLVGRIGGPGELQAVFDRASQADVPVTQQVALLASLEESAQQRKVAPAGDISKIKAMLASENESLRTVAARLVGLWKKEPFRATLTEMLTNAKNSLAVRQSAVEGLVLLGGPETQKTLLPLIAKEQAPEVRRMSLIGLVRLDGQVAAVALVEALATLPVNESLTEVFSAFLQRKGGADALAKALEGKTLPADLAKLGVRAVRSSVQDAPQLVAALTKAGSLGAARPELTAVELKKLVEDVTKLGSAERGESIYRRKDMACMGCHGIGGNGGQVGPDLTSIGASAQIDYLVESILLPNKAIKENYHSVKVITLDGKVFSGIKIRDTKTELVLRTAEDKELTIPVKDIDDKQNSRSLMPDGLADPLTRQELVDLVRFLSELGKVGPYSLSKNRLARRWQYLEPTPENMNTLRRGRVATAAENESAFLWSPAYSVVAGDLPLEPLPKLVIWTGTEPLTVLRAQLDVTAAGKVKLKLNSSQGITAYLGSVPVELKDETVLELPIGMQTLTLAIDRKKRSDPLRLEVEDVADSPARVRVVGGK